MKDKSTDPKFKLLGELKLRRVSNFWLIYELIEHDEGDYWTIIASMPSKARESNIALYERAQKIITEGEEL